MLRLYYFSLKNRFQIARFDSLAILNHDVHDSNRTIRDIYDQEGLSPLTVQKCRNILVRPDKCAGRMLGALCSQMTNLGASVLLDILQCFRTSTRSCFNQARVALTRFRQAHYFILEPLHFSSSAPTSLTVNTDMNTRLV